MSTTHLEDGMPVSDTREREGEQARDFHDHLCKAGFEVLA